MGMLFIIYCIYDMVYIHTSLVADLSVCTGKAVKAADGLPLACGLPSPWRTGLTAHRHWHLHHTMGKHYQFIV